ncbi:MAG: hypothetical protein EBR87_01550 [Cytophagia bacterium]|nr:hypothetical protein [Cytophagia bacterium]
MNKRLIAFLSILSLSLSLPFIPANAAAKAGAKCAKAGSTEVVKDKSYTCVKSGKKIQMLEVVMINCFMLGLRMPYQRRVG